jgi:hypothetical protein
VHRPIVRGWIRRGLRWQFSVFVVMTLLSTLAFSEISTTSSGASGYSLGTPGTNSGCPSKACSSVLASVAKAAKMRSLPSNLTPSLSKAAKDLLVPAGGTCGGLPPGLGAQAPCTYESPSGPSAPRMVLFGESHAWQWSRTVASIAAKADYSLGFIYHTACFISLTDLQLPVDDSTLNAYDAPSACHRWLEAAIQWINNYNPSVILVAAQPGWDGFEGTFLRGLLQVLNALKAPGRRIALIGGVPHLSRLAPDCLAAHESNVQACSSPESSAVETGIIRGEMAVTASVGAHYINDIPWLCTKKVCPAVIGHYEVYQDQSHITSTYANYLAPVLTAALKPVGI